MNNKNLGFTLVELLAVIVILAIISVIAVPRILKIVEESRQESFRASVRSVFKAASVKVSKEVYSGNVEDLKLNNKGKMEGTWVYDPNTKMINLLGVTNGVYIISGDTLNSVQKNEKFPISKVANAGQSATFIANSTSNSIEVVARAEGFVDIRGYRFSKNNGDNWTGEQASNTYNFTELSSGAYKIIVKIIKADGTEIISHAQTISTLTIDIPTYSINPALGWSPSKTVTIDFKTALYTKEYSLNGGLTWETSTTKTKSIIFNENGNVIARISDGFNVINASVYNVMGVDATEPESITISIGAITSNSMEVICNAVDSQSGIASYQFSKDNGVNWTDTQNSNTYTFINLNSGSYVVKVKAINNAGLSKESSTISQAVADLETPTYDIQPKTTWASSKTVTIDYKTTSYTKQYSKDGGLTWETSTTRTKDVVFNENGNVIARITDGTNTKVASVYNVTGVDATEPESVTISIGTITSNSIQLIGSATDSESGIIGYQFSKDNGETWTDTQSSNTYTFNNIGGTYSFKIKAINGSGLSKISNTTTGQTITIDIPTYSINPALGWSPSKTVTIDFKTALYTKEYSLNGGLTWETSTTRTKAIVFNENGSVIARITDGSNIINASVYNITNIDTISPTISFGTNGGSGTVGKTTVIASDNGGSQINNSTLQYKWDTQNTTTPTSGWTLFTNESTISLDSVEGTYYLWVKVSDNAGNSVVSKSNAFELSIPVIVNKPSLTDGMIAKKWSGGQWVTVEDPENDTSWYNYKNQQWANAMTSDGSMWVWIPRYIYKISSMHHLGSTSLAGTINIQFSQELDDNWNSASIGYIDYAASTAESSNNKWTYHPAFNFGGDEVTGIWVAKFEASNDGGNNVKIIPNVISWRNIMIGDAFSKCLAMETNSRYGWGTTGNKIDTHLMKNTEWGAVSYLAHSIFGTNGNQVYVNPDNTFLTGRAGTSVNNTATASTYSYETINGVKASTTNNITGVYDMSGGSWEYVAAYINNNNSRLTTYGSSMIAADVKYKNLYPMGTSDVAYYNYDAAINFKGDAIYETSNSYQNYTAWYYDKTRMPAGSSPFFLRGGYNTDSSNAGLFAFDSRVGNDNYGGLAHNYVTFRPVLIVDASQ